jgi:tripartite-type tricarboxylate transporter receptor subunit TctC
MRLISIHRGARKTVGAALLLASAWLGSSAQAAADSSYPTHPIRILVSFSPGGPTDLLARGLARHMTEVWKQQVIVENRPGAGGTMALRAIANAAPDGYTLVVHSDGYAIAPAVFANLPFDPLRDLTPIAQLAVAPNVLCVSPASTYKDVKALEQAGKTAGKVSYASAGFGSAQHMQAAKFASVAGILKPVHVPFKGTPEALVEVMSGRVDFVFAPISTAMPLIRDGKLRPIAISTSARSAELRDVPTIAESVLMGFNEEQWWGLFSGAKVPEDIKRKLQEEVRVAMKSPEMVQLLQKLYSTPSTLSGPDFASTVKNEIGLNKAAAHLAGIVPQ